MLKMVHPALPYPARLCLYGAVIFSFASKPWPIPGTCFLRALRSLMEKSRLTGAAGIQIHVIFIIVDFPWINRRAGFSISTGLVVTVSVLDRHGVTIDRFIDQSADNVFDLFHPRGSGRC